MRLVSIIFLVSAASIGTAQPAAAQEAPEVAVAYHDLDLAAPDGRAALEGRIQAAARSLCNRMIGRDLPELHYNRQCQIGAVEAAREQSASLYP